MSLQYKIIVLAGAILAAMAVLATAVFVTAGRFGHIADNLYDNAFVGVHYAHKVEVGFVRFEAAHPGAIPARWSATEKDLLQTELDDMDVAIERAPSPREKQLAEQVRGRIAALAEDPRPGGAPADLKAIDQSVSKLVQQFADRALDLRTDADDLLGRLKLLLWLIIGGAMLVGLTGAGLLVFEIVPPLRAIVGMIRLQTGVPMARSEKLMRRKDEIGAVARALVSARQRVNETLASLEDRVQLRTHELERAKEAAESANVAKSAFLATMSHEIRTPLNGVLGMAQAMALSELSPVQRERIQVIRQSGEALLAILNDVLDISKIEAGKLELERVNFDLETVVRGAHSAFTQLANAKGLSFSLSFEAAKGIYLGDPTRLRQILYNLISNAIKFTEIGEVRVEVARTDDGLKLRVADTGPGMSPETLAKIFSKFSQADASTTRRFGGTGLGLAICRELAGLMGGEITVESRLSRGSVFTVSLKMPRVGDAAPAQAPGQTEAAPLAGAPGGLRVLVAEDNSVNQLVLKTLLHQVGIDMDLVENGAEAVKAWTAGGYDLILMDVQMPVMDGPTATQRIRLLEREHGLRRTPIIALTANVMAHQVDAYRDAGMDAHIAKPIDVAKLIATIDQVLTEPQAAPAAAEAGGR